jgi:antitoxin component of RelBE/YafQ-DinJ toxin-antitoxin module
MSEKKNLVQEALEEVAKKRGIPLEKVVKEAQEYDDQLRKSGTPGAEQSAREHEDLINEPKKK